MQDRAMCRAYNAELVTAKPIQNSDLVPRPEEGFCADEDFLWSYYVDNAVGHELQDVKLSC